MADDSVHQVHHTPPTRPTSPHPQYVRAKRERGGRKRDEQRDEGGEERGRDRVTISTQAVREKEGKTAGRNGFTEDARPRIDVRI